MPRLRHNLGSLEKLILEHVADKGPILARDVTEHFEKKTGRARTTVLTVMDRLREKGYLKREKLGLFVRYTCKISRADLMQQIVGTFVDDVLHGRISPFVAYLTKSRKLTSNEIRKLEQLLKRLEAKERGTKK
ncbi:MAG TPA: BlaI/MecI/CopY family transcriptional regulator [Planctomycetaceae bacterium]|nr:BlaI/MecI/CopY family transcriptional regulator [Planctomycetaceae bacterium]